MRNLKKVLTLVLTLAMLLSVMVVGAGAATFNDQDSIKNDEAVDMCVALSIIGGYEDGTFRPTGNVTRAEMCKMICVALNGGKEPTMGSGLIGTFNDVATSDWSAPYIEYCVSQGIVGGVGGGRFNPNGNITGTQAAKMLLCILGYNASIQGYVGNDYWETKINVDAAQKGLYDELGNIDASAALTRDQAAQMIWNALQAYEVEYVTTLVTGPNGELTSKVTVQDKVVNAESNKKITLLKDKYEAEVEYGYMTKVEYSNVKSEYTYTFADASFGGESIAAADRYTGTLTTAKDFSDLFGQKVAVVYKDVTAKTVYGMYGESAVVASDIVGNVTNTSGNDVVASDDQIKIGDNKFKLDQTTVGATGVYIYNVNTASPVDLTDGSLRDYYSIDAIDHDGDNKIDCFVVYPIDVQKVTYVGTSSINAGVSYSYDKDSDLYSNSGNDYDFPEVSKDDWVAINQYGVDSMTRSVATLETVQGEVTALKGDDIQINNTWYEKVSGTPLPSVGDTVALTVVGSYYFDVEVIDSQSMDNVLMVLNAAPNSTVRGGVEAKVMYAKDGTVDTISSVSKVNNTKTTTAVANATYKGDLTKYAAGQVVVGALYTYKEKDGAIELTMLANDVIGSSKFDQKAVGFVNSTTKPTVDSKVISDDAVVMAYNSADDKFSFTTGAVLKTWKATFGDTAQYLYETVDGVPTITAVALYDDAAIPGTSGTTGYGYVTSDAIYTKADDTDYAVLSVWSTDGDMGTVKAESISNNANNAWETPSNANVKTLNAVQEGAFITFEKLANGNIDSLRVVGTIAADADAMYGAYVNKDGETELSLSSGTTMKATKDTQIIYVNTEDKVGGTGTGVLKDTLATETAATGVYVPNVVIYDEPTADGEAEVIFIDVNYKLDGAAITAGGTPTSAGINGILASDDVTVSGTLPASGIVVPADKTLTLAGAKAVASVEKISGVAGATLVLDTDSTGNYVGSDVKFYSDTTPTELSTSAAITAGTYVYTIITPASDGVPEVAGWVAQP